jgi:hypothetical protein
VGILYQRHLGSLASGTCARLRSLVSLLSAGAQSYPTGRYITRQGERHRNVCRPALPTRNEQRQTNAAEKHNVSGIAQPLRSPSRVHDDIVAVVGAGCAGFALTVRHEHRHISTSARQVSGGLAGHRPPMSRLTMIWISGAAVLVVIVVGNAVAQSEHVNGFAVAAVDLALACVAGLFVRRTRRSVSGVSPEPGTITRRAYSWVRGRNAIALAVVLGLATIGFLVAGMERAAVRTGLLCVASIYLAFRTISSLKRLQTEGKIDRSWPII